jgi:hypothetical protein
MTRALESQRNIARASVSFVAVLAFAAPPTFTFAAPEAARPTAPTGVWRGSSTCVDLVAAPACHDEVVVYEFTAGATLGTVHWKADKVVDGQREPMGEMDLAYDTGDACWRAELSSPRVHSVWCLAIDGAHMTGTARLLPGNQIVRKIDVRKD